MGYLCPADSAELARPMPLDLLVKNQSEGGDLKEQKERLGGVRKCFPRMKNLRKFAESNIMGIMIG
jgi:hypothetical protein